jgi:tRNA (guanine-N7-)-methyltransferase
MINQRPRVFCFKVPPGTNKNRPPKIPEGRDKDGKYTVAGECNFASMSPDLDLTNYPMPRVRHHVSPQSYLPAHQQQVRPSWYPPPITDARWELWFGKGAPASVLDIGCGRGGFLLRYALAHPEEYVLGLEVRETLVNWINGVINGERISNARALWYSVANGLDWIPDASIHTVAYLFPDPWPKKRHHKRRAFTAPFLDQLARVLTPEGALYLATDRPDVDEYQTGVIMQHGVFRLERLDLATWPFAFATDQQLFCERKDIPYVLYKAHR